VERGNVRIRLIGATATAVLCLLAGCQPDDQPTLETLDKGAGATATASPTSTLPSDEAASSAEVPAWDTGSDTSITGASGSEPTPSVVPTTPDDGLSEQERADRAAVEAQWIKSWNVYRTLSRLPEGERQGAAAAVAVDPALTLMLQDAQSVSEKGWDTYGTIGHRISWPKPIDGTNEALINDCQDGSLAGSLESATGTKKTVGVERALFQGAMRKGDDGVWRLVQSYFLKDEQC
jgi:hypothetical protein